MTVQMKLRGSPDTLFMTKVMTGHERVQMKLWGSPDTLFMTKVMTGHDRV